MANGSVFRVVKDKNYTCINNTIFKEKTMSLQAIGLLCLMLSLPDEWDYSLKGLCKIRKESINTISKYLKELRKFGYLEVIKHTPNETSTGRYEYEYLIYETPVFMQKNE